MTAWGFWVVAALSSQMRGFPLTRWFKAGKSRRIASTSRPRGAAVARPFKPGAGAAVDSAALMK